MIFPVILCGGSGQRLWPISRQSYPKQFIELVDNGSLFQQSATRMSTIASDPIIVTNNDYRFIVRQQLTESNIRDADVIIEPESKNTAPAILVAALHISKKTSDGLMVVMPSDHYIPDNNAFEEMIITASEHIKEGQILCLGVQPNRPENGYGYIKVINTGKDIYNVDEFVEKPNLCLAKKYLSDGNYLWNSGIFITRPSELLKLADTLQPEMMQLTKVSYAKAKNDLDFIRLDSEFWKQIDSNSFDYSFMERAPNIGCLRFKGSWSDLGDWNEVAREKQRDQFGNSLVGNAYQIDSKDCILWSDSDAQVLTGLGLDNIIAIATSDAIMVAHKSKSQEIKKIVNILKNDDQIQAMDHIFEHRPWGSFKTLARGENFHVKVINVLPGRKLSLQSHKHRSEHWVVTRGTASVTNDFKTYNLEVNESTFIKIGAKHMLKNDTLEDLQIIEIQIGNYLKEDDIVRYQDDYNRS